MAPVDELKTSGEGRPVMFQVFVPEPPVADRAPLLYVEPTVAEVSVFVAITRLARMTIEMVLVAEVTLSARLSAGSRN